VHTHKRLHTHWKRRANARKLVGAWKCCSCSASLLRALLSFMYLRRAGLSVMASKCLDVVGSKRELYLVLCISLLNVMPSFT
jgi:hypothetical protein